MADWEIQSLNDAHVRSKFDCGVPLLNDWLKQRAGQFERRDLSRTYIATKPNEFVCHGYYSLSTHHLNYETLPNDAAKGLPRVDLPVVLLGRLAVCQSCQGMGLGETLLIDAMRRVVTFADKIGIRAIEVDAIDESAKRFYLKYGFRELKDDTRHLYIAMHEVRKLKLPPYR